MNAAVPAPSTCRNCEAPLSTGQAYCAGCGQKTSAGRLTMKEIGHDFLHAIVHVDHSVLSLVRVLLLRPGTVALDYVQGRRKRYFGPFALLVVVAAAASALVHLTGFRAVTAPNPNAVADFLQAHVNLVFLAQLPLLAAFSRLLDARGPFNYAEHLVLAAYASSLRVLFVAVLVIPCWYVFAPGEATARHLYYAYLPIWPLYFGFATSQFLPGRRALSWCKGIMAAALAWAATQGLGTLLAILFLSPRA
jgi:hypothetical protein